MSTLTTQDILNDRAARKTAGLTTCKPPEPEEFRIVFGYKDIWTWKPEDPMEPHCFCFDCRDTWDPNGTIDLQLIQNSHKGAMKAYASLFQLKVNTDLPAYTNFEEIPMSLPEPTIRDTVLSEIEEKEAIYINNLRNMSYDIDRELIHVMDSRRRAIGMDEFERNKYLSDLQDKEEMLWKKKEVIESMLGK